MLATKEPELEMKIENRDDFIEAHLNYVKSRVNERKMYLIDFDEVTGKEVRRAREAYNDNYKRYATQPELCVRNSIVVRIGLLKILCSDFEAVLPKYKEMERDF